MPPLSLPSPPALTAEARHYFAAAARGRLELQFCQSCAAPWFFPRPTCPRCGGDDYRWAPVSGGGVVESFTIVTRAPSPAFRDLLPYVVAVVALAEGPRMIANIVGADALEVTIGAPVEVVFETRGEGRVPQFACVREDAP